MAQDFTTASDRVLQLRIDRLKQGFKVIRDAGGEPAPEAIKNLAELERELERRKGG
jgi:hypothetical protein